MFYHVITNTECNLECKYCVRDEFGKIDDKYDYSLPCKISYDISKLKAFVKPDDYVTFYGGEPLLAMDDVKKVMDTVVCKGFMVQTNGLLLKDLKEYASKFHTILVSIDGCEECTDRNRGKGVYAKVMSNVAWLRSEGFNGELIARMTISEGSDLYKQVLFLNGKFSSIHWQLDAMFFEQKNEWFDKYNNDVSKLVDYWVSSMREGLVLRWYPFMVLMHDLLKGLKARLRCGSGYANYTVNTKGTVVACPIMCGMKEYYCGDLDSSKLKEVGMGEPCASCTVLDVCGGRCLYSNITKLWNSEDYGALCGTVRHLINCLVAKKEEVMELLEKGTIALEDFDHLKFNGVEVIP
tara:strand:- start:86 stop:1138 length:1053 start_codon:yes stop_codon:yes gene_type:complete